MPTQRLEAFSDGVFAIAITLLVLDFPLPDAHEHFASFLWSLWPTFLAYGISFLLIGLVWANHHSMFMFIRRADRTLLFLNTLLLADVAFLPFPTRLLAQSLRSPDLHGATFFYGLVLTIGGIFHNAVWLYASRNRKLLHAKMPAHYIARTRKWLLFGPLSYGVATGVALLWPVLAIIFYVLLILFYWLPPKGEAQIIENL